MVGQGPKSEGLLAILTLLNLQVFSDIQQPEKRGFNELFNVIAVALLKSRAIGKNIEDPSPYSKIESSDDWSLLLHTATLKQDSVRGLVNWMHRLLQDTACFSL